MSDASKQGPSKSQLKRKSHALQKLGEKLVAMPRARFDAIDMPQKLREAVLEARTMKSRRALYRQRQYIGRLMRELDAGAVKSAIEQQEHEHKQAARRFHHLETWRDRLLAEGEVLLGELLAEFPAADRQHVRQLIRHARQEADSGKPPAHARSLFRYLQSLPPRKTDDETDADW